MSTLRNIVGSIVVREVGIFIIRKGSHNEVGRNTTLFTKLLNACSVSGPRNVTVNRAKFLLMWCLCSCGGGKHEEVGCQVSVELRGPRKLGQGAGEDGEHEEEGRPLGEGAIRRNQNAVMVSFR